MTNLDYKHYIIDMSSNNNFVQFNTMQGDGNNVRGFEVELIQYGVQYMLDANDTIVAIAGTKPDGTEIFNECTVTEEGYILVDITSQMSAVVGKSDYNIILMSQSNNSQLKSFPFHIIVTPSAFDINYLVSTDEFQLLAKNVISTEKLIVDGQTMVTNLETLEKDITNAENARISNEARRISNENGRSQKESERNSAEILRETNTMTAIANAQSATASATEATERANAAAEACENLSIGGVTGIKGETETDYRTGNVSLSATDVGAIKLYTNYNEILGDVDTSTVTIDNLLSNMQPNSCCQMDIAFSDTFTLGLSTELVQKLEDAIVILHKGNTYSYTYIHDIVSEKSYIVGYQGAWIEIANADHNHNDTYYTKTETNNKLSWMIQKVLGTNNSDGKSITLDTNITENTELSIKADINPGGINDDVYGNDGLVFKIHVIVAELTDVPISYRSGYVQDSAHGHGVSFKLSKSIKEDGTISVTIQFEFAFFDNNSVTNVDWTVFWR